MLQNTPAQSPQFPTVQPQLPASQPQPQTHSASASSNNQPLRAAEISSRRRNLSSIISSVIIIGLAPVVAILLTLFVFQSYQVDGPSMETTLQDQDRLIVWKAPRTLAKITSDQYVPNRGDIVIFNEPGMGNYENPDGSKQLIKRVIGLPGERVAIVDGVITVYNQDNPNGFSPDKTLPYGRDANIEPTADEVDVTLGTNELFVSGDNRPNSMDSRMFGPITTDQIIGKLVMRILPINNTKVF